jgi:hypothetical protein
MSTPNNQIGRTSQTIKNKPVKKEDLDCPDGTCPLTGPENGGADEDGEFQDDLFNALIKDKDEPAYTHLKELIPNPIQITERNIRLGQMIGQITKKIDPDKRNLEVGGLFLVEKGDMTFTYKDFIIPQGLHVTQGSICIDENYDAAARENKKNNKKNGTDFRMAAMFHIHPYGKGQGLWHSEMDNEALDSLVTKMAKTTRRVIESPFELIQNTIKKEYGDNEIVLRGDALSDAVERIVFPDDDAFFALLQQYGFKPDAKDFKKKEFLARLLDIIDRKTMEPRAITFAASFVFNNAGDPPYVKLKAAEYFTLSKKSKDLKIDSNSGLSIQVIEKGANIPTPAEVEKLVKDRVIFPPLPPPIPKYTSVKNYVKGVFTGVTYYPSGADSTSPGWTNMNSAAGITYMVKRRKGGKAAASADKYQSGLAEKIMELSEYDVPIQETSPEDDLEEAILPENENPAEIKIKKETPKLPGYLARKTGENIYSYDEFAHLFTLAIHMYQAEFRHKDCRYSMYVNELLHTLAERNIGSYIKGPKTSGLRSAVMINGPIVEDNPNVVEKTTFKSYFLNDIVTNIHDELMSHITADDDTMNFIGEFISTADTKERSVLLEKYVANVLGQKSPSNKNGKD